MIIHIEALSKRYGEIWALRDVSLDVEAGTVVGLLGPNGAGKTTFVEIIEGLRVPTSGRLSVMGFDPTSQSLALKEKLGVQLQTTALPEELTPLETLRLFASFYQRSIDPRQALRQVGLDEKAHCWNSRLSLGQQRRLAIATALINDPELIILDEPTSGLDPVARREIHQTFTALRELHRTLLVTTHLIDEAEHFCDRVIMLRDGEIVADGSPRELIAQAAISSHVLIAVDGEFDAHRLSCGDMTFTGREGEYYRFQTSEPTDAVLRLGQILQNQGTTLTDFRIHRATLEDIYVDLMGEVAMDQARSA